MNDKLKKCFLLVTIGLSSVYMLFFMHIYIANVGGGGFNLPHNFIVWGGACFIIIVSWLCCQASLSLSVFSRLFIFAAIVLTLPVFYTQHEWIHAALLRVSALWLGCLYFISLERITWTKKRVYLLLFLCMTAATIQAVIFLIQFFDFDFVLYPLAGSRPAGVFQQPNVLASFLAMGLGCTTLLLLDSKEKCENLTYIDYLLFMLSAILTLALVLVQSRTGIIGIILGWGLIVYFHGKQNLLRRYLSILVVISAVSVGVLIIHNMPAAFVDHTGSNLCRWELIYRTVSMIIHYLPSGIGYGGFEYTYQDYVILQFADNLNGGQIFIHPHNEFLYWIAEGGIVAFAGMIIVVIFVVVLIYRAIRHYRCHPVPLALIFCISPVVFHTQTEFPFYISSLHFILFLTFIAVVSSFLKEKSPLCRREKTIPLFKSMIVLVMSISSYSLFCGFSAELKLNKIEQNILKTGMAQNIDIPLPGRWFVDDRVQFDSMNGLLLRYNLTHNPELLDRYQKWATSYLNYHFDKNVYISLISILRYKGDSRGASYYQHRLNVIFLHK
ncbi:O-antigen ligase family protein [Salmonella enterica]|nr:O-antigen ligase family protein [Salmonella enterica]